MLLNIIGFILIAPIVIILGILVLHLAAPILTLMFLGLLMLSAISLSLYLAKNTVNFVSGIFSSHKTRKNKDRKSIEYRDYNNRNSSSYSSSDTDNEELQLISSDSLSSGRKQYKHSYNLNQSKKKSAPYKNKSYKNYFN